MCHQSKSWCIHRMQSASASKLNLLSFPAHQLRLNPQIAACQMGQGVHLATLAQLDEPMMQHRPGSSLIDPQQCTGGSSPIGGKCVVLKLWLPDCGTCTFNISNCQTCTCSY